MKASEFKAKDGRTDEPDPYAIRGTVNGLFEWKNGWREYHRVPVPLRPEWSLMVPKAEGIIGPHDVMEDYAVRHDFKLRRWSDGSFDYMEE